MKQVTLITDGSCIGNPGPGGWAALLRYGSKSKELVGSASWTTNNRMEMTAVVRGLEAIREPCRVTVETDSEYVKNGITRWIRLWRRNGWITAARTPVKNRDLWRALDDASGRHKVQWRWVKGHASHADNNRCDKLARAAALSVKGNRPKRRQEHSR